MFRGSNGVEALAAGDAFDVAVGFCAVDPATGQTVYQRAGLYWAQTQRGQYEVQKVWHPNVVAQQVQQTNYVPETVTAAGAGAGPQDSGRAVRAEGAGAGVPDGDRAVCAEGARDHVQDGL